MVGLSICQTTNLCQMFQLIYYDNKIAIIELEMSDLYLHVTAILVVVYPISTTTQITPHHFVTLIVPITMYSIVICPFTIMNMHCYFILYHHTQISHMHTHILTQLSLVLTITLSWCLRTHTHTYKHKYTHILALVHWYSCKNGILGSTHANVTLFVWL